MLVAPGEESIDDGPGLGRSGGKADLGRRAGLLALDAKQNRR
jgi:hypothetical protein